MSDTPSTFLMLAIFALLICRKASYRIVASAAFLFGLACLFRINNILFVPAIGAICWVLHPEYFQTARKTVLHTLLGAGIGFLVFLPQLLANWKFYGNPMTFGYTNYAEGSQTFLHWIFIELNTIFYGTVNQIPWIPGILALFCLRDPKLRIVLTAWIVPVIFFFYCYSYSTADPIRFILTTYPALFLAIAASSAWEMLKPRDFLRTLPLLAGWILCIPNAAYGSYRWYLAAPYRMLWRLGDLSWLSLVGVALIAAGVALTFRESRRAGTFLAACSVLYLLGNGYCLALGFVVVLIYAMRDFALLFRQRRRGKRRETPVAPKYAPETE